MSQPLSPDFTSVHGERPARPAPLNDGTFTRRGWLLFAAAVSLILAPMVALPLGPDEAMFFVSAQKILHQGAVHYRDIVDVKPPLIYYMYAAALAVLGDTATAPRLMDLALQLVTVWLLVRLMRSRGFNDTAAAIAGLTYALLYGGLGFSNTMQAESYLGLAGFGAMLLLTGARRPLALLGAGALAGATVLFKYPMAVIPAAIILAELILRRDRGLRTMALLGLGMAFPLVLFAAYLTVGDAWSGFAEMNRFIAGYVRTTGSGAIQIVHDVWQWAPVVAANNLTIVVALAAILGAAGTLTARRIPRGDAPRALDSLDAGAVLSARRLLVLRIASLLTLALLASLVAEGKYFSYQTSRLYPFVAIIAAEPLMRGWQLLRATGRGWYTTPMVIIAIGAAFMFGPVSSWLWSGATPAVLAVASPRSYHAFFQRMGPVYPYADLQEIGSMVRRASKDRPDLVTLSIVGGLIHEAAGSVPRERIFHSAFLTAPFAPSSWRAEMRRRIVQDRPQWIVIERQDTAFMLTGVLSTSEDLIDTLDLRPTIDTAYTVARAMTHFTVYRRKSLTP